MTNVPSGEIRVLLPAKPEDDLADVGRVLRAILPAGRAHVRRFYVHRPLESDFFLPQTYERFLEIPRPGIDAEIAARAETEPEMRALAADGFQVSSEIVGGAPAQEVLREASLWRADLVGVRSRSAAARDNRIGRMASALLHHATCPVLTHHAVAEGYRVGRILIPVDFSAASRRGADWGLALAELTGAEPVLLHVVGRWVGPHGIDTHDLIAVAREEIERWRAAASAALSRPVAAAHVVTADTAAEGIVSFAEGGEHDLVVLPATGASALRAILLGSTARKVVRASAKPVLVVPASNRVSPEELLAKGRGVAAVHAPEAQSAAGPAAGSAGT